MQTSESISEIATAMVLAQTSGYHEQEALLARKMFKRKSPGGSRQPWVERFFNKIAFTSNDCWVWLGSVNRLGYGQLTEKNSKESKVHRFAWDKFVGPIPEGKFVLHKCDVRFCCNPDHLFLGDQDDNMKDAKAKGRIKNVPQYGEDNPMSRLTQALVKEMRTMRKATSISFKKIAERFGVSTMTAYRAITKQSWK